MTTTDATIAVTIASFVFVSAVLFFVATMGVWNYQASVRCLELGYPSHRITLMETYCIKRVDQTDEVKKLD